MTHRRTILASSLLGVLVLTLSGMLPLLPIAHGQTLDAPFTEGGGEIRTVRQLAGAIFSLGIWLVIIAAAIYIAIGAYAYFAAAGNAAMAQQGKEIIQRSIIGLILGLLAFILLQTISPQFTALREPSLPRGGGGGLPPLPERPARDPRVTDPNIRVLLGSNQRILNIDQVGENQFRFPRDQNAQPVGIEGVRQRVETLVRQGQLRPNDTVMVNVPPPAPLSQSLYQQLNNALVPYQVTVFVPEFFP